MKRREMKFVAGSLELAPDRIAAAPRTRPKGDVTPKRRPSAKAATLKRRFRKD